MKDPLDEVLALEAAGQFLSAHDRAMAALGERHDDDRLRHRAVLALARAGATRPALTRFQRFKLQGHVDPDIAALEGRLLKDLALRAEPEKLPLLAYRAAGAYEAVWRRAPSAQYPAINAATLALLAGDRSRAWGIARHLRQAATDDGSYWAMATLAEACLLLGDVDAARRHLEQAEARAGDDFAARATTRRQLRIVAASVGAGADIVTTLRIPLTVHYCGHMPPAADGAPPTHDEAALAARIKTTLMEHDVGFAFGALAAGADILFAEALMQRGAQLTVVLPFDRDAFVRQSVLPFGAGWLRRFDHCLAKARVLTVDRTHYPHDELDFGYGARRAMGLARLHAQRLDGGVVQFAMWDGVRTGWEAGTAADIARWATAGGATINLGCPWQRASAGATPPVADGRRQWMGVLFGDLPRFSTLDDAALGAFYRGPLAEIGRVVDRHAPAYRNAWGDAVQLAFASCSATAACALELQRTITAEALTSRGLPETLVPRLALDHGPVLPVVDAVQGVAKFAGRVMTRAARIEPVTPPGQIYATEAFACEVALDPRAACACDYAGEVPTAKGFGALPLYAVHPPRPTSSELDAALRDDTRERPTEEAMP
jgi:hypothetical protein